jgi:hypothetical protein
MASNKGVSDLVLSMRIGKEGFGFEIEIKAAVGAWGRGKGEQTSE